MNTDPIQEILFTEEAIQKRITELVGEMVDACRGDNVVLIGILRGSFIFLADLVRELHKHGIHLRIDFMTLESYHGGTQSTGTVHIHIAKDIKVDVTGADTLLIDDILDTGGTLSFATRHLLNKGAGSVKTCTLLDKPSRRVIPCKADYTGFMIDDVFIVGYGLDYQSYYRELPYIAKGNFE
ncbi:MAG: hypoxanthine phosphoribosyltransferase [Kiritimatiellae bacterium]|nr:hypoxanthine phosphoribosyltransferase [Kiritimatiellia bacterium]